MKQQGFVRRKKTKEGSSFSIFTFRCVLKSLQRLVCSVCLRNMTNPSTEREKMKQKRIHFSSSPPSPLTLKYISSIWLLVGLGLISRLEARLVKKLPLFCSLVFDS